MIRFEKMAHSHFVVRANEPCRVEVTTLSGGHVVAFAYRGTTDDLQQEPVATFDSHYD